MATYSTREVVTRRREWVVPAAQPWGAAWEELDKALAGAAVFYRQQHGLDEGASVPGDFARVFSDEEAIVITVTVERVEPAA